jgi:hypothetical protein
MSAGGCLRGAVRYEVQGSLPDVVNCHCSVCRRWHGHRGAYTSAALDGVRFVEDRGLVWYESASDATPGVRRGTIKHVWTSRQGDYYEISDQRPSYEHGSTG